MMYYLADVARKFYLAYQILFGPKTGANLLLAYSYKSERERNKREELIKFYMKERRLGNINSLMIDSGTFSLKDEPEINESHFDHYFKFIKEHGAGADHYFAWDRDFRRCDDAVSYNQEKLQLMIDAGLKPIPVIHYPDHRGIEPDIYINDRHPIIALGWLDNIEMTTTKGDNDWVPIDIYNNGLMCHMLGRGSEGGLVGIPNHSSDSTTYMHDVFNKGIVRFKPDNDSVKVYEIPVSQRRVDVKNEDSRKSFNSGVSQAMKDKFTDYLRDTINMPLKDFFNDTDVARLNDIEIDKDLSNLAEHVKVPNPYLVSMYFYINVFPKHIEMHHKANKWDTSWKKELFPKPE
jgi:hypothetical protein